jgi:hypothetical protein
MVVAMTVPVYSRTVLPAACQAATAAENADAFISCARAGTDRYRDHNLAVLDGYRRIGRDFPGMGEHWIRVSLVFDGVFDASRPEVLNYVTIDGTRHLLGVAYAVPLLDGERPPESPAGRDAWHDHSRTISDETILPLHMHGSSGGTGSRLAMLHAWVWSTNPDGVFAADNWAIPFVRLELATPAEISAAMGKALSLAVGGRDYFEMAIAAGATLSPADQVPVKRALDDAQHTVESLVRALKSGENGRAPERLAQVWARLWADMESVVSEDARRRLALLPIR